MEFSLQNPTIAAKTLTTTTLFSSILPFHHPQTLTLPKRKNSLSTKSLHSIISCNYYDQQKLTVSSAADEVLHQSPRVYVGHSIYKGKAALTASPKPPEFTLLDSGAYKVLREGAVLLQFAPSVGIRQYDWSRKQVFSLSVPEVGSILCLDAKDSCEFFHDPFKGKSEEGKIRKILKVEPLPDGSGHFFNLSVQNRTMNVDENIYIPITKAEFAILKSAFNFIVPHLLGWAAFANSIKPESSSNNTRYDTEQEWGR
ncbi:DNA-binding protein p24 [Zostera marina]|uniref:DNA-binding protein p24 n=1 Tax=Zostera marina TaxID=29655 RepID=A0A0K9PHQ3_ZOSMR|nr:DNA-binding protein p24 [Zostera marina]